MKKNIFDNWALKLSSVAIAIVLWVVVYNINDPVITSTVRNVPVTFVNTEALTDNGQVFEVLNGTDVVRSISMSATRSVIDDLKDSDIKVEADFTKMKLDGTVEIRVYSEKHNDAISFKTSTSEVQLLVEDKVDRYLSLDVELTGEPREGYIVGNAALEWNRISVSGAESKVAAIDKAKAIVDITDTSEDIFSYADIVLYDKEGTELSRDGISLNMRTVGTTVEILKTKTVPVVYHSEGIAAEGYSVTGEIMAEIDELEVAGKEKVLAALSEIVVEGDKLYFEDAAADVALTIDLDDYLPNGIIRADKQGNGHAGVTVRVSPIIEREYTIRTGQVQLVNIPEGYSVVHVLADAEVKVTVRGSEYLLEQLNPNLITGEFDVTAWMEVNHINRFKKDDVYMVKPVYELSEGLTVTATSEIQIIANVLEE